MMIINDNVSNAVLSIFRIFETQIPKISNGEIFEHGYPEARLIPANHVELCLEQFADFVADEVREVIKELVANEASDLISRRED